MQQLLDTYVTYTIIIGMRVSVHWLLFDNYNLGIYFKQNVVNGICDHYLTKHNTVYTVHLQYYYRRN